MSRWDGKTIEDRFWENVDRRGPDDCWEWKQTLMSTGYGRLGGKRGFSVTAHRFSWELHNGPIPKGEGYHGTCVCHKCDNRACCNPAHLFLGTVADNARDMVEKGRSPHPPRKLTDEQVLYVFNNPGISCYGLGKMFGIGENAIRSIRKGASFRYLKPPIVSEE